MADIDVIRRKMEKAYQKRRNWRKVGDEFGVSEGMAWRIVNEGYEPKDVRIRVKLGLPSMELAPVCPKCGVVHVAKRCTEKRRKIYRRNWSYWMELSEEEIWEAFENREEMKHGQ